MSKPASKTYYERIKNKRISNPSQITEQVNNDWSTSRSGFAAYISHRPQFKKGTLALQVRQYLGKRTKPASINDIASAIMKTREYSNERSARRSTSRVLGQLVNWRIIEPQKTTPVSFILKRSEV